MSGSKGKGRPCPQGTGALDHGQAGESAVSRKQCTLSLRQAALAFYLICFGYFHGSVALGVCLGLLPGQKRSILRRERRESGHRGHQKAGPRNFARLAP